MAKKKIHTGQAAENAFVTGMGGKLYKGQAGSQATDIVLHHPDHGTFDAEMKAGGTIDFSQMRMDVEHFSGQLRQTVGSIQSSGDVTGKYKKPSGKTRDVIGLVQRLTRGKQLTPGTQDIERPSRTKVDQSGNPIIRKETRPAAKGEVPTKRLSLKNKNAVTFLDRRDPVHIAIHHKTGEVALIPTKNEHAHLGDKMGLKKTVTYDHIADEHGHKNTLGVKLRGPRAKGGTFNASIESSSGNMVNAIKDAGGHVFDSLDHATKHLRSHGWGAETGHAMNENVEMTEGIYDPITGYQEIYRMMPRSGDKEKKKRDSILRSLGLVALRSVVGEDDADTDGPTAAADPTKTDINQSWLDTIGDIWGDVRDRYGTQGGKITEIEPPKFKVPKLKEQVNSSDEDDEEENTDRTKPGTKPGQDQSVPYQTPEPGEKVVNADAGGGSPYVKPAKTVMLGDEELEEGIRKSFSDFLLKEKNIDIIKGVMEPFTDINKDNINQTASMILAAMINKNNNNKKDKKEKKHSCECPHNK